MAPSRDFATLIDELTALASEIAEKADSGKDEDLPQLASRYRLRVDEVERLIGEIPTLHRKTPEWVAALIKARQAEENMLRRLHELREKVMSELAELDHARENASRIYAAYECESDIFFIDVS